MEIKGSVALALSNPKSPSNVGAVMRAAGCYGASGIYYTGQRFERAAKFHQDTKNVSNKIALTRVDSFVDAKQPPQQLVCIELVEGATPLPEYEHPEHAIYVFGPEDGSVDQALVDAADAVVYVPTIGCMNLAATVNVLLYDRMAKQHRAVQHKADDQADLIRSSRDVNNRLVVKS